MMHPLLYLLRNAQAQALHFLDLLAREAWAIRVKVD